MPVFAVMSVTHHDNSQIAFGYTDNNYPYYLAWRRDENEKTIFYDRDTKNRVWQIRYPDDGVEVFSYDDDNLGQVRTHQMTSGGTEHFRYDNRGLKTLSWPPATLPGDPNPQAHPTQYFYYTSGRHTDRLAYVIDPRGKVTRYEYNDRGLVSKVIHPDETFAESKYYDDGTLEWTKDELGHKISYIYDDYKRVTKVTNHLNEYITTSYDPDPGAADLSLTHTTSSVYQTTSFMGRQTECKYDRNFRKIEATQAPGTADQARTSFAYDEVGNLSTSTDPRLKVTSYGYDDRNRQLWVRNDQLNETTQFRYDPVGNKTREIRSDGVFRTWKYDEMNRVTHAYDWRTNELSRLDQTTTYDRDHSGNPLFITDAKGAVYSYVYDALNRKESATYPADGTGQVRTETWRYDYAGNLDLYTNPAGQKKHIEYDDRNRAWHSWWEGGAAVGQEIVTDYDEAGRVEWIETRANGNMLTRVAFGYDDANRKLWEDQTVAGYPTRRVKTDLDGDGKRENLQIVDPPDEGGGIIISPEMAGTGSYSIAYQYTNRNQLWKISGEDWRFEYSYDGSGNMTTRQAFYNGVNSTIQCPTGNYDALNRPTRWNRAARTDFRSRGIIATTGPTGRKRTGGGTTAASALRMR